LTAKHKTNGKYFYQYPGLGNIVGLAIKSDRLLEDLIGLHRMLYRLLMALCDQLKAQLITTQADSRRLLEAVLRDALAPATEEAAL